MFHLTLVDHIRLSFASIVGAYEGHAAAAARLARWAWYTKVAMLSLVGLAAIAGVIADQRGGGFQTAAAAITAIAFVVCAAYVALDPEPRVYAHRASAARLWLLCEKYRALLTEVHDELLDAAEIARRRDALLQEATAVFEHAPPADQQTYDIARKAFSGGRRGGYTDEELDTFLPVALRRESSATSS
jgi:SMODS and SLOG-associating 2TM effector domain family 4